MDATGRTDLFDDRREELFTLVNMVGYAREISAELGASGAALHLDAARKALVAELEIELRSILSQDGIAQVLATPTGRC